ncbi:MAG: LLM class flavin-dependent oxidoreductase [Solirubrobacterales bacterium]|nr:LLM class flavin-dependent oxidoreductase [Solirubrobacterales bacterium]
MGRAGPRDRRAGRPLRGDGLRARPLAAALDDRRRPGPGRARHRRAAAALAAAAGRRRGARRRRPLRRRHPGHDRRLRDGGEGRRRRGRAGRREGPCDRRRQRRLPSRRHLGRPPPPGRARRRGSHRDCGALDRPDPPPLLGPLRRRPDRPRGDAERRAGRLPAGALAGLRRGRRRVDRDRPADDGDGGGVRQRPQAVRAADRLLPGGLPPLRPDAAGDRELPLRRLRRRLGRRRRARVAAACRLDGQGLRLGHRLARPGRVDPGARRGRLHLGARPPLLPQAGESERGDLRRRQVAPRPRRRRGPGGGRRAGPGLSLSALDRISVAAIGTSIADLEAEAKRAEAAGAECVWAPELFRSSMTQAAYLAGRTERIGVATGIAWAFTRSPFILAVSALDIDEMSGGRFRLGLGSGVKRLNETWHNAEYGRPAPHLREAIEATRLIMQQAGAGEPIRFEGDYYDIDIKGWVRPHPAARESVPIYTAGVQGGMCRMAGDVADGLIGHPIQSLRWIDEVVVDSFEQGLRRSGRERKDFDYLPTVCCAIDDDEGRAIEMARRTISFYATVKTYMPLWELHGFADDAVAAGDAFRRGDLAAVPAAIGDEMVDTYCAAGPLDKVRARVEATAERADGLFLTPPTYFISPEELSEYQSRLIDAFGPEA